jgi:hypothetical protein
MTTKTLASNGSKATTCARCKGEIPPYAGVAVNEFRNGFTHHPGQCADAAERSALPRELARQGTLFGWRCDHVEPSLAGLAPVICRASGTDHGEYEAHMKDHGARPVTGTARIKLGKRPPAASLPKLEVNPFRFATWTERIYADWRPGVGNELISERERRGQFWAQADGTHCYWYMPLDSADRQPIRLYVRGDGTLTPDWSDAKSSRRDANRVAKYRKAA